MLLLFMCMLGFVFLTDFIVVCYGKLPFEKGLYYSEWIVWSLTLLLCVGPGEIRLNIMSVTCACCNRESLVLLLLSCVCWNSCFDTLYCVLRCVAV